MHLRLALALFVSILVVGGATWVRFTNQSYTQGELVALENNRPDLYDETFLEDFLATSTTSKDTLNNTDLISRQLVLDYIGLASTGEISSEEINSLAEKYVNNLPYLNQGESINISDINVVSSTRENLLSYVSQMTNIMRDYAESVKTLEKTVYGSTSLESDLSKLSNDFYLAYYTSIPNLEKISVPSPLASTHLQLTNSFISSANAAKEVSDTESDSLTVFSALITLSNNVKREQEILAQIEAILINNGI